jgi:nucleoside-diphosphate-sugar epimerase
MNIFLLGMGFIGTKTAEILKQNGHHVTGTTTTPSKVDSLKALCDDVLILRGDEVDKIKSTASKADLVVVTVGPNLSRASNPATREEEYRQTLSITTQSASASHPRCIFTSSLSVYGDGGAGAYADAITEETPVTASNDPSPRNYKQAEENILASGHGTVLRFPDVYGSEKDLTYIERVKLGHTLMKGKVPFSPDALLYRIHYTDAARAIVHVIENNLLGIYNVVDNRELPPTNKALFDKLADEAGVGHLEFLGFLKLPARKISGEKFIKTGFIFEQTDYIFK